MRGFTSGLGNLLLPVVAFGGLVLLNGLWVLPLALWLFGRATADERLPYLVAVSFAFAAAEGLAVVKWGRRLTAAGRRAVGGAEELVLALTGQLVRFPHSESTQMPGLPAVWVRRRDVLNAVPTLVQIRDVLTYFVMRNGGHDASRPPDVGGMFPRYLSEALDWSERLLAEARIGRSLSDAVRVRLFRISTHLRHGGSEGEMFSVIADLTRAIDSLLQQV